MLVVPLVALVIADAVIPRHTWAPASAAALSSPPSPPPLPEEEVVATPELVVRVVDADGEAVMGATVRLLAPRAPFKVLREGHTDQVGSLAFAHDVPQVVRVFAEHAPQGVATIDEARVIEGKTTHLTLVLSAATVVRGTVVNADDKPVEGASLSLEGVPWTVDAVTSDASGAFAMFGVPEEAYGLVATARGYKAGRVSLAGRKENAETVVKVVLSPGPPIDGEVREVDGSPVRANVVACKGRPFEVNVASGADGSFQLPPSTIGCDAYALHVEEGATVTAPVVEGQKLILQLQPGGIFEGVVVDARGAAITPFEVGVESSVSTFTGAKGSGWTKRFDDPHGVFRFDRMTPGTFILVARAAGKPPTRSDPIEVKTGKTISGIRIVLLDGGAVVGTVVDDRRAPVGGARIAFDAVSVAVGSDANAQTDAAGRYRIEGAPTGPFSLRVEKEGYRTRFLSGLRVAAGGEVTRDVVLTAVDGGGMELGGIGAMLRPSPDGVFIASVYPGDPADRAGIRKGDRVLRVDGDDTAGMSLTDVLQRLRGEPGTMVSISLQREGETQEIWVERAAIVH